ncbi:bifunctional enoyl-CoA hydratase/phosphate acetyltransferase [Caulobacter sp.]|uniref:bifunctional enoyl-CoA hydratase/phosphate acetyltransferase n=1 Tax=Caulobacter sp. TaxID=78 RepID=UPI003BA99A19
MSTADFIENRTFDEIRLGEVGRLSRALAPEDLELSRALVGGLSNGAEPAWTVWSAGLLTATFGLRLPGPGAETISQTLRFLTAPTVGDTVTATVEAREKTANNVVVFDCRLNGSRGELLANGSAEVRAPAEKLRRAVEVPPDIRVSDHDGYRRLIDATRGGAPAATAIVHPCSAAALLAAVDAAEAGLIAPILVGPEGKIRKAAEEAGKDLSDFRIVPAAHSHEAAAKAVELVRSGQVQLLMKGSLHTDELMGAVVASATGLRTERRISHVYVMDVPSHPAPLLITDAAINIAPTLLEKADIIRNAIDLAHVIGIAQPRVAILSAVETVNPALPSTLEAAALCKMADRGQIAGGLLDGPLAFDNAVSEAAAAEKGIVSPVAGKADILVAPTLEAGNMLAKQLTFLGGADAAGVVLGARVPIILTSRADSLRTRLASCAVAVLMARAATKAAPGLAKEPTA